MQKAFTLIELLVVISMIALLVVILLPVLTKARFAVDHDQGYPSKKSPAFTRANPWDTPKVLADSLIGYGMRNPGTWFCAADDFSEAEALDIAQGLGAGNLFSDLEDMKTYMTRADRWDDYLLPLSYWAPRSDNDNTYFPTIGVDLDHPDGWAVGVEDGRALVRPILTDKLRGIAGGDPTDPSIASPNGHRGGGRLQGATLLFGDGRVAVPIANEIKARSGPGYSFRAQFYAFY